jgi:lysophospholipase L1-like esterase
MNNNKKVIILILSVTIIQLILSVFSSHITPYFPYLKNINIIADLLQKDEPKRTIKKLKKATIQSDSLIIAVTTSFNHFEDYNRKGTIVSFDQDSLSPALKKFNQKLLQLAQGKKVKIRIAWFGDSQIEGDFVTEDIRKLLQIYFGGQNGVGFVPINSIAADFRHTAKITTLGTIKADNFKKMDNNSSLFFSGYSYFGNDITIDFKDNTHKNTTQRTEKWLLYGKGDSISVKINDSIIKYPAESDFNKILLENSTANKLKFQVFSNKTPLYGISSEPESGIVLDNFSFRGITGVELKKLNVSMLSKLNETAYYDLIVFQYGVNLMFKPDDTNYDYYYHAMNPVLKKLKDNLHHSEFLILSCSDRAFKYEGEWKTAIGIDSLVNTQAKLAYDNKLSFYNFYQSMGGNGTMVKWADSTEQLANKDYIHFNFRGSKHVAKMVYKALMNDYYKAIKKKSIQKPVIKKDTTKI